MLIAQRKEQRQRVMIQHQRQLHKASFEKRAVIERKIKATRKNAELMIFEQKSIFDEKGQRQNNSAGNVKYSVSISK